jgi:4-amino-4-deoxy-L-arabinose transferase-like glycosyltransferase
MNGPFINKPPLMLWTQAVTMSVLGPTSVAARLPALLFAILAVLGTFLVGRELVDRRHGAVAAALLGGSVAVHLGMADPKVDLALMAMTTWAIWAALASRRRPRLLLLAWLFAGLAVLAKGPVGLGIVVVALAPEWLRISSPPGERARERGNHLLGFALFLAVAAPFYVAQNPDDARFLLWTQGFGRLLGQSAFHDSTTPLYFVHTGLWALLPMTPLLVVALGRGAMRLWRERTLPADVRRVPAWWFGITFVVISAARFKLPQYVYWVAPPAALLAAGELLRATEVGLARWR